MSVPPPPGIGSTSATPTVPAPPSASAPAANSGPAVAPLIGSGPAAARVAPGSPGAATATPVASPVNIGTPIATGYAAPAIPVAVSCESCVFYIAPDDIDGQNKIANRPMTGGAMCGKYRLVLSTMNTESEPGRTNRELTRIGSKCGSYRKRINSAEVTTVEPVEPKDSAIKFGQAMTHSIETEGAVSCQRCVFHVKDADMKDNGILANACALKSVLIPNGNAAAIAGACDQGIMDDLGNTPSIDNSLMTIRLEAHLDEDISDPDEDDTPDISATPGKRGRGRPRKNDPTAPSNLEAASEDDIRMGIKGWTKVVDKANSERFVMLPVFDPNHFDAAERAKIPQAGDDEHPEMYQDHQNVLYKAGIIWRKLNETPALNGVSGVGKTEFFRYAAFVMQLPFERISITNSTELDDLAGKVDLIKSVDATGKQTNYTEFVYGRIPKAWAKPCVIVIDEPNVGPSDVWQFLRPLTDNSKQLVLDINKGERISRNEYCFMGMAMNPTWDTRNVGTHEISDADGSRLMHISMPAPDRRLEEKILKDNCKVFGYAIPAETLSVIMNVAVDIRQLAKEETIDMHWGTRQQIKVAKASEHFDLADCYRMAAADLLDPDQSEALLQCVQAHMPSARGAGQRQANRRAR